MRRSNTFDVRPLSHRGRLALVELLDGSSARFNEINYDRRQAYFSARDDSNDHHTVSELEAIVQDAASQEEYRNKYIQQLSSSIPQQIERKNWRTWKGFFDLLRKYRAPEDDEVTVEPSPPGYWKDDGTRRLHTVVRNDTYTVELGEWSRLEIPMGQELKEKYGFGYHEKLRLAVRGLPHWTGPDGRLELTYDRTAETFTGTPIRRPRYCCSRPAVRGFQCTGHHLWRGRRGGGSGGHRRKQPRRRRHERGRPPRLPQQTLLPTLPPTHRRDRGLAVPTA